MWQLVAKIKQLYWEKNMERDKTKVADVVKSQIQQQFVQSYGSPEGSKRAICPLDRAGHGQTCKWGHLPLEWTPKLWLVVLHLSPLADVIHKYYSDNDAYPLGLDPFPPFVCTPQFSEMFTKLKSQSGPDPQSENGGSASVDRTLHVSRSAMKAGALVASEVKARREDEDMESSELGTPQTQTLYEVRAAALAIKNDVGGKTDADLVAAQASMLQARVALVGQLTAAGDTSSQDFLRVLAQSEKTKVMEEAKRAQSAAKDTIMVPDDPLPGSPGESAQQGRTQGT